MKSELKSNGMLENKVAVIYGAGGSIGGAVARAFAAEGAHVYLTGHRLAPVEAVAKDIVAAGGQAEAAAVDALDERAVDQHLDHVVEQSGRVDISFNAVGIPIAPSLGVPLLELDAALFSRPVVDYAISFFLTARLAARRMIASKSGVIMTVTALPARMGFPLNGGYGPAQAAKEALVRCLSGELAAHGIRVVGVRPHGLPETALMKVVYERKRHGSDLTWEQFTGHLANTTHARRGLKLAEVASVAAFMASDRASGMSGTNINLSLGTLDD